MKIIICSFLYNAICAFISTHITIQHWQKLHISRSLNYSKHFQEHCLLAHIYMMKDLRKSQQIYHITTIMDKKTQFGTMKPSLVWLKNLPNFESLWLFQLKSLHHDLCHIHRLGMIENITKSQKKKKKKHYLLTFTTTRKP